MATRHGGMRLARPTSVGTNVSQNVRAELPPHRLDELGRQRGRLMVVRRFPGDPDELKAKDKSCKGQREYDRFHGSLQQQEC